MSHMVIYRGTDGKPGYHQTDDIHDAVLFVEQLRNDNGVEHARIFRLEEVNFEYRPYFRVELKAGDAALGAPPAAAAVTAAPATVPVVADPPAPADTPAPAAEPAPKPVETASAPAAVETKVDEVKDVSSSKVDEVKDVSSSKVDDVKEAASPAGDKVADNGVGARRGLFGR